jgi:hypothetical protein
MTERKMPAGYGQTLHSSSLILQNHGREKPGYKDVLPRRSHFVKFGTILDEIRDVRDVDADAEAAVPESYDRHGVVQVSGNYCEEF